MNRFIRLLFDRRNEIDIVEAVSVSSVHVQRDKLNKALKKSDKISKVVSLDSKRMKQKIDTAIATAAGMGRIKYDYK